MLSSRRSLVESEQCAMHLDQQFFNPDSIVFSVLCLQSFVANTLL